MILRYSETNVAMTTTTTNNIVSKQQSHVTCRWRQSVQQHKLTRKNYERKRDKKTRHCIIFHILIFYCMNSERQKVKKKRKSSHFKVTEIKRAGTKNEKNANKAMYTKYTLTHKRNKMNESQSLALCPFQT